jgi:SPX domain protein involved in polyphosphate accumulation
VIRRFNRFELKYILHVGRCAKIIDELKHQIPPDRHGGEQGYPIVSLYYDSPQLDCFWAKIEGIRFRRKVRLRIYPGDDISQVNRGSIEIKQRINKTVQKRRLELPLDQAERLCAGDLSLEGLDEMDTQVAHEVTYLSRSLQLQPTAITAYWRRAFEGQEENAGVRVTFDTLVASRIHALTVNAPAKNRLILPADHCIMEVKADERVPEWATSLLARHDCQLSRVSKYCAGVATLRDWKVMPLALSPGVPVALEPGEGDASNGSGRPPWLAAAADPDAAHPPPSPAPPSSGPPSSEPPHG